MVIAYPDFYNFVFGTTLQYDTIPCPAYVETEDDEGKEDHGEFYQEICRVTDNKQMKDSCYVLRRIKKGIKQEARKGHDECTFVLSYPDTTLKMITNALNCQGFKTDICIRYDKHYSKDGYTLRISWN